MRGDSPAETYWDIIDVAQQDGRFLRGTVDRYIQDGLDAFDILFGIHDADVILVLVLRIHPEDALVELNA